MTENESAEKDQDELSSDEMASLADFDAEISPDELKQLENAASTRERLHQHKLCLIAMSSSSGMLKQLRRESPEEFDAMFERVESFQEYARGIAELSQKAYYRMLVIGSLTESELQD